MNRNGHGRRNIDELLIAELVRGRSYQDAGRCAGVSVSTVGRRMADPDFRDRLREERDEILKRTRAALVGASLAAAATLEELATSADSERVRITAARAILDLTFGRTRFEVVPIEPVEVTRLIRRLVDLACERIPENAQLRFLEEAVGISKGDR